MYPELPPRPADRKRKREEFEASVAVLRDGEEVKRAEREPETYQRPKQRLHIDNDCLRFLESFANVPLKKVPSKPKISAMSKRIKVHLTVSQQRLSAASPAQARSSTHPRRSSE